MPEDTKGLKTGVLTRGRVPGAGADCRRREPAAVRLRARPLRRRAAVLLLRQRRSGVAHDVARDGSRPSGLRPGDRRAATRTSSRSSTSDSTRSSARRSTRLGPDDLLVVMSDHGFASWRRAFHLNSWLRDQGYLTSCEPGRRGRSRLLRQRRLVADARLRARPERALPQPPGPREPGHRRAGERGARWSRRSPRSCWQTIDPGDRPAGDHEGLSARAGLRGRGLSRRRARSDRRLRQGHARLRRVGARRACRPR